MDFDPSAHIAATKKKLKAHTDVKAAFERIRSSVLREVDALRDIARTGAPMIPEVAFCDIRDDTIRQSQRAQIKARGCVVVRGVFTRSQAEDWDAENGAYLTRNAYFERAQQKAGIDKYFSALNAGQPQIFGL